MSRLTLYVEEGEPMTPEIIDEMVSTLRAIRNVRDYHAEHGEYPTNLEEGQEFDDWAADMADAVLQKVQDFGQYR